jgi:hypothetical protein
MDRRPAATREAREEAGETMKGHLIVVVLLATGVALADDAPKKKTAAPAPSPQHAAKDAAPAKDDKKEDDPNLGMSILGNQEAPKALVIVPWKSSEIGKSLGIATMLDDSRQPVDREVFMRMLSYYAIRSNTTAGDAAPTAANGRKQ